MKALIFLLTALALAAQSQPDAWKELRVFEGSWQGATAGKPGKGTTTREYRFELNGRILSQRDLSVYQPADPSAKPQTHEDFGVLNYDSGLS